MPSTCRIGDLAISNCEECEEQALEKCKICKTGYGLNNVENKCEKLNCL